MKTYIDIHTHRKAVETDSISVFNLLLHETTLTGPGLFSAGLHPWHADQLSLPALSTLLDHYSVNKNLFAIGECGLDKNCKVSFQKQQEVFELQLKKSSDLHKPIIIHCVRAWEELIEITAGHPSVKILHGYNGSEEMTKRLVKNGFSFSVGEAILKYDSKIARSIQLIPPAALFLETDMSQSSIQTIYAAAAVSMKIEESELCFQILESFKRSIGS